MPKELPEGWKLIKLKDLFNNFTEKNHADKIILASTQDRGVIPHYLLGKDIIRDKSSLSNYKLVKKGFFIISLRSFQGGFEYSNYEGIVSPAYTILEPKKDIVSYFYKSYFKSHFFINNSLAKYVEGIRDGKQIKYEDCKNIKVPFPPLDEQKRIAEILSLCDLNIENLINIIEKKELYKKAIMQKLLKGEKRFKGFNEEWSEIALSELIKEKIIFIEKGTPISKNKVINGCIPVIAGGQIPPYYHNNYTHNFACITISASGASAGYVWFHNYTIWASDCNVLYTDSKKYNINFLYYYLSFIQNLIYKLQTGGVQPHVYAKEVITLNIPNTNIEEQKKIAELLTLLDEEIDNLKKELQLRKEQKKSLMNKLLNGEIRV